MKNIQFKFGLSFDVGSSSVSKDFSWDMDRSFLLKSLLVLSTVLFWNVIKLPLLKFPRDNSHGAFPIWSVLPFFGMLFSIAVGPLIKMNWWEKNITKVCVFWALMFAIPAGIYLGGGRIRYELVHIFVMDYVPFILLVGALFIITGGINVGGELPGIPTVNLSIMSLGAVLASIVGTTGATILLIRPLIKANRIRKFKTHTMVFLIFIVSNIGGVLTPLGDPPLFIGYLHKVPFFWTINLWPIWLFNVLVLLGIYFLLDTYLYTKEKKSGETAARTSQYLSTGYYNDDNCDPVDVNSKFKQVKLRGKFNLLLLLGVAVAIISSGVFATHPIFFNFKTGIARGVALLTYDNHTLNLAYINILRDGLIIFMAALSLIYTPAKIRKANNFTWGPIGEVTVLFAGIFATIIPALNLLQKYGSELNIVSSSQFFWVTGILSSFLDNTPTYLAFINTAAQMGSATGIATDLGNVNENILAAISCGAVFMGANTYIGNAPNFMVKAIAEENNIQMPCFFKYMLWSGAVLIPLFLINTVIFF